MTAERINTSVFLIHTNTVLTTLAAVHYTISVNARKFLLVIDMKQLYPRLFMTLCEFSLIDVRRISFSRFDGCQLFSDPRAYS